MGPTLSICGAGNMKCGDGSDENRENLPGRSRQYWTQKSTYRPVFFLTWRLKSSLYVWHFLGIWILRGLNGLETQGSNFRHRRLFVYFSDVLINISAWFFFNIDFAMYSVQPVKIFMKNVNFKGLKWTRTQKIRIFVTADCFGIFADFKSTFWPYFLKT